MNRLGQLAGGFALLLLGFGLARLEDQIEFGGAQREGLQQSSVRAADDRSPGSLPAAMVSDRLPLEATDARLASSDTVEDVGGDEPGSAVDDPLAGLVDFYLGDGVFERKMVISQRLRELTDKAFKDLWDLGAYEVIQGFTPAMAKDSSGRPRPTDVRGVGDEMRMVVLSEQEHPEAWILLEALSNLEEEMNGMRREANNPSPQSYR